MAILDAKFLLFIIIYFRHFCDFIFKYSCQQSTQMSVGPSGSSIDGAILVALRFVRRPLCLEVVDRQSIFLTATAVSNLMIISSFQQGPSRYVVLLYIIERYTERALLRSCNSEVVGCRHDGHCRKCLLQFYTEDE